MLVFWLQETKQWVRRNSDKVYCDAWVRVVQQTHKRCREVTNMFVEVTPFSGVRKCKLVLKESLIRRQLPGALYQKESTANVSKQMTFRSNTLLYRHIHSWGSFKWQLQLQACSCTSNICLENIIKHMVISSKLKKASTLNIRYLQLSIKGQSFYFHVEAFFKMKVVSSPSNH